MMRFDEMQAFLAVMDHGSFHAAAVSLGVSRTTLRRQVESLEARIGTSLFGRTPGGVVPTEVGRRLALGARGLEREYRELLGSLQDESRQPAGELRMVVPSGMPPQGEVAATTFVKQSWPGIRQRIRVTDDPLSVSPDDTDIFVYFGTSAPGGAWRSEILSRLRMCFLASRAYLEARGTPSSAAQLCDHDLLVWHLPGEPESAWLPLGGLDTPPRIILATTSPHLVIELAYAGEGIAYVPSEDPPMPFGPEPLIPVLPELAEREVDLRVAVAHHVAELPKVRVFLDNLHEMGERARKAVRKARPFSG